METGAFFGNDGDARAPPDPQIRNLALMLSDRKDGNVNQLGNDLSPTNGVELGFYTTM